MVVSGEGDALNMAPAREGEGRGLKGLTRQPLGDDLKHAAWTLSEVHRMFCDVAGRSDMPLQYVTSFLLVAMSEGESVNTYAERAGVSKSVMSRHLLDIGPRARNASLGFGLVETRPSPHELRRHEVYLTPKGRALAERVLRFWKAASGGHPNSLGARSEAKGGMVLQQQQEQKPKR